MTQPALLIFATCYDDVTRRTCGIARRLLADAKQAGIEAAALFDVDATSDSLLDAATRNHPRVVAFYSHGNDEGAILTQKKEPCWTVQTAPDLSSIAVFAHACRGLRWLRDQLPRHHARLLVGYENDILTPKNGSTQFWELYEELHSFIPQKLAAKTDDAQVRRQFYELCTARFHKHNVHQPPLMEIVAIIQSRDQIVFM
jgi:hypothetical protein